MFQQTKERLLSTFFSGKNNKFIYYLRNYLRLLLPGAAFRRRRERLLQKAMLREDWGYILTRVNYYNRLKSQNTPLPPQAQPIKAHRLEGQKVYFFDTKEFTRWFPTQLRWGFFPGDVTFVPPYPGIVKSRPLVPENANGVLMKLDKVRHFIFVKKDPLPFRQKKDLVIFRGKVRGKESRLEFMRRFATHPLFDAGAVDRHLPEHPKWMKDKLTIPQHLHCKFILALEGNDVASNLKWVMSSNSVAVMPPPTCETWFMEGTLIPNHHYICIKPDFSDLVERIEYYIAHPEEAEQIARNAQQYVQQFKDKERERIISLLVMEKYFICTGQLKSPIAQQFLQ